MNDLAFFLRGCYPFESIWAILLNLSAFNRLSINQVGRRFTEASVFSARQFYSGAKVNIAGLPTCRYHGPELHFPYTNQSLFVEPSRLTVRFCRMCLAWGYHSVFFCQPQVRICTVHDLATEELCEKCCQFKEIPSAELPCPVCGFYLAAPPDQVVSRLDPQIALALYKSGVAHQRWYRSMVAQAEAGQQFSQWLERCHDYSIDPVLKAYVLKLGFTGVASDQECDQLRQSVLLAHGTPSMTEFSSSAWLGACHRLAQLHLRRHEACLGRCAKYLDFWDGETKGVQACLMSITYFLMRLRFAVSTLRQGTSRSLEELDLRHVANLAQNSVGFRYWPELLVRAYYLKLLFHLHAHLQCGMAVRVILRAWSGMLYEMAPSVRGSAQIETLLGVTPYSARSCGGNIRQTQPTEEGCMLYRDQDGSFLLVRGNRKAQVVLVEI